MKAISLHQPWASMIARGDKTIETRHWSTNYRGDLLICSTKKPCYDDLPLGKALCIVELVNCRPMTQADEKRAFCMIYSGAFVWELGNIRRIKPFDVRGSQGFYEVDFAIPETL